MPRGNNQIAKARNTEGGPSVGAHLKSTETKRQRGRPPGAKNKPKELIPSDVANSLLLQMKDVLPPEHFEYLRSAIREGKVISTKREVQTMMLLLSRNLYPAMVEEMKGEKKVVIDPDVAEEMGIEITGEDAAPKITFRKDITERLKVLLGFANLAYQMEKGDDEGSDTRKKPIFEVYSRRGMDGTRIRALIGIESDDMGGSINVNRRPALVSGAVSDQLPERQIDVSDSEQVETGGVLYVDIDRDNPRSDDEKELQGEYRFDWGEGSEGKTSIW